MNSDRVSKGLSVLLATLVFGVVGNVSARPTGEPQACLGCHYDTDGPAIAVDFSNPSPDPSETIVVTVSLDADDGEALRTGVFLSTPDQGAFSLLEPTATRFAFEDSVAAVVHAQPRELDTDGRAQFQFEWTAPAQVGVSDFTVWSMTGNSNGEPSDDHHARGHASIPHGCDATNYYPDADGDGFGDVDKPRLSCEPVPGLIAQGGDCNDDQAQINPDAAERCNALDDDCDGEADQGLEPALYYPDPDGDGFAADGAAAEYGCATSEGLVPDRGDCAPDDPDVYPGAPEVANGRDDNCNGETDEADVDTPGADDSDDDGVPAGESGEPDTMGSAGQDDDAAAGGCAVQPRHAPWSAWLIVLALGLKARRRSPR